MSQLADEALRLPVNRVNACAASIAVFMEYADEAEHQDGAEYWDNFETITDVLVDFGLYLGGRETI